MSTQQLVTRLAEVRFEESIRHNGSRLALMREYLRRSAMWAQALGCLTSWPFYDIAVAADPSARLAGDHVETVLSGLAGRGLRPIDKRVIPYMLNFTTLRVWPQGLPDPFEPLLMVYERGGSFGRKAGSVVIGHFDGVPERHPEMHAGRAPEPDLSPAALDALDRVGEERREEAARRVAAAGEHGARPPQ
ncbi:hypothetical protein [Catellatospora sp. NPDC049609]|uniref:hypothetical protein n=1 Tax=Catellatospora sp. NPDC049609 TaxID=3155505 RepID=UPI00342B3A20